MRNRIARIAIATVATACSRAPGPVAVPPPTAAPSARTAWVRSRSTDGLSLLEAPAVVLPSPEGQAAVAPPFRARVARIHVRVGQRVRRGQTLADVVMPEVVQAAGSYAAATTRLEAYAKRKSQLDALRGDGLVRLTDLLEAETRLAEARAEQQGSLATLRAAQLEAGDVAVILSGSGQVALKSPIEGMVTSVHGTVGEAREPGGEPMVRVAGEGESRIEARFARAWPEAGARYELVVAGGQRVKVALVARAPAVDPRDGAIVAWFQPPPEARVPAGLAGRLEVGLPPGAGFAVVPARAVALDGSRAYVVVHRSGVSGRVPVEVLASSGADALVRGLAADEEVAADASLAGAGNDS